MNRELLPREEYYRPRRAAELRRQARDLRETAGLLRFGLIALAGYGLLALCYVPWPLVLLAICLSGPPVLVVVGMREALLSRADSRSSAAAVLEAEHRARYGVFPREQVAARRGASQGGTSGKGSRWPRVLLVSTVAALLAGGLLCALRIASYMLPFPVPLFTLAEVNGITRVRFPRGSVFVEGRHTGGTPQDISAVIRIPPGKVEEFVKQPAFTYRNTERRPELSGTPEKLAGYRPDWHTEQIQRLVYLQKGLTSPDEPWLCSVVDLDTPARPTVYLYWTLE